MGPSLACHLNAPCRVRDAREIMHGFVRMAQIAFRNGAFPVKHDFPQPTAPGLFVAHEPLRPWRAGCEPRGAPPRHGCPAVRPGFPVPGRDPPPRRARGANRFDARSGHRPGIAGKTESTRFFILLQHASSSRAADRSSPSGTPRAPDPAPGRRYRPRGGAAPGWQASLRRPSRSGLRVRPAQSARE